MQIGFFGKISRHIAFPDRIDLAPFRAAGSIDANPADYSLHSVIVHIGGASSYSYGHYICFIRSADNIWYKCDDDEVKCADESEVANSAAYMLFYQRVVPKPSPHQLAHAACLQPIQAARDEHEAKLEAVEDYHDGKENVSAAANAVPQVIAVFMNVVEELIYMLQSCLLPPYQNPASKAHHHSEAEVHAATMLMRPTARQERLVMCCVKF